MSNKLELTWVGKEKEIKVEPRILIENPDLSNTAQDINTENMLIHGDNLLALKALESKYAGQVKCIYIDPPYNTGYAFKHYDDGLEHSIWLNLMYARLTLLRNLLSKDGSIWVNLDDNECHYCKVMLDEIFGRKNFLCDIAWEKRYSPPPDTKDFGYIHDHILVYRKDVDFNRNLLPLTEEQKSRYKNPDNDPRGVWKAMDYTCRFTAEQRPNLYYSIKHPITGEDIYPSVTRVWSSTREETEKNIAENKLWWGLNGKNKVPAKKNFLSDIQQGMMPMSLWHYEMAGTNQDAKKESMKLFGKDPFDNPKPEKLLSLVMQIATQINDLVLDSFLGSGTTAAVAHKMGRKYIGIEMGNHAYTHCKVRLDKVISGEDKGGITKSQNWQGGGGYRFYELAPTLILQDDFGQEIINPAYNADMLASAVALHEGYTYAPDENCYFKQAHNGNNAYLYVTTRHIDKNAVNTITTQLSDNEYLIIVCKSFDSNATEDAKNVTVKKIPQSLLDNCEFGKDDYKLNIVNPPIYEDEDEDDE